MTKGAEILCLVICFLVGYFAGNISPATVVGKMYGIDIRKEGSGNPGTTNVLRTLGKKAAAGTLVIDVLKGFLPAAAAGLLVSETALIVAATGAILGHMWPVFFQFKGGKGVASSCISIVFVTNIINNWFIKSKGKVLGIVLSSSGIGGAVFSPIVQKLMDVFGFRWTFLACLMATLVLCAPFALLCPLKPENVGLKPYGADDTDDSNNDNSQ